MLSVLTKEIFLGLSFYYAIYLHLEHFKHSSDGFSKNTQRIMAYATIYITSIIAFYYWFEKEFDLYITLLYSGVVFVVLIVPFCAFYFWDVVQANLAASRAEISAGDFAEAPSADVKNNQKSMYVRLVCYLKLIIASTAMGFLSWRIFHELFEKFHEHFF